MGIKIHSLGAIAVAAGISLVTQSCTIQESDLVAGDFNIDKPLAYAKRPVDAMTRTDPRTNAILSPGGNLFLHDLDDGPTNSGDINITAACTDPIEGVKGAGDVMSISASDDGQRILFAMHMGVLEDNNAVPNTWDIWEYLLNPQPGENALRMVISGKTCGDTGLNNLIASDGNDLDPAYLPDGRIVFTSDRQAGGRSLQILYGLANEPSEDETRRESALNLHVMNAIGKEIKQISYNQSDDRFPSILHTGEIVFSRWERAGITESRFDLYTVHPDGSDMKVLYGSHSHFSTAFDQAFYKARQMADGRLVAMLMPYSNFDPNDPILLDTTSGGGELVFIDYENFADLNDPRIGKTSAQAVGHVSATRGQANTRLGFPSSGRFSNPFPIWEEGGSSDRILISLAYCRVVELDESISLCPGKETLPLAPSEYGLFYLNTSDNTTRPVLYPETDMVLTDAVIMLDRTALLDTPVNAVPLVIEDKSVNGLTLEQDLIDRNMGAIKIRSVYDTMRLNDVGLVPARFVGAEALPCMDTSLGNQAAVCDDANSNIVVDLATLADPAQTTADQRPVRYVRVVGAMPSFDGTQRFAFGVRNYEMRAILGYAPVEPDGSVYVEVPADKPFALELVSKDGHKFLGRIPRRNSSDPNSLRTYQSHDHWLQVIPGETLVCNGCHEGHNGAAPLNGGAIDNSPFTNTIGDMLPNPRETMAETRIRYSCTLGDMSCTARLLNRDLVYSDVWTDPAVRLPDVDFAIEYNDRSAIAPRQGLVGNAPIYNISTTGCKITDYQDGSPPNQGNWGSEDGKCRIVIDYEQHIQSLWDQVRLVDDGMGGTIDRKCTICHSTVSTAGGPQIPAGLGQLDLTSNGPSATQNNNGNRITSYEELLRTGLEQEIVGTAVQIATTTVTVPVLDENGIQVVIDGVPQTEDITTENVLGTGPVVSPFFARNSYFTEVMTGTELKNNRSLPVPTVDHTVMMTRGEIRVVSEWIEMGVQYFNNPGAVP